MDIERFKSKLSKDQLEAMAIDAVKKQLENVDQATALRFAKKLKFFADVLVKEAETEARQVWENIRDDNADMTYTQGGDILDYNEFEYRKQVADHLKDIDKAIRLAQTSEMPLHITNTTTGEVLEVPKVSIKDYRKDSINVRL